MGDFDQSLPWAEDLDMWLRIARQSKTPVLWGSQYFLVDRRLRPGAMTRDTTTGEAVLDKLLAAQAPELRRHPAADAYVRPALLALKYGSDATMARSWAGMARSSGSGRLARSTAGRQLLLWDTIPAPGRRAVRSAQSLGRAAVKGVVSRLSRSVAPRSEGRPVGGRRLRYRSASTIAASSGGRRALEIALKRYRRRIRGEERPHVVHVLGVVSACLRPGRHAPPFRDRQQLAVSLREP